MEHLNAEKTLVLEASVVENVDNVGKDEEVVVETEAQKDENEVVDTFAGEKSKEDEKFVETFMDAKSDETALNVVVEENKTENETVKESPVLASFEASSSGIKKPQGLRPKAKIVRKVKRLVKKKSLKGTAVQVASEENVTVEQGVKKDEQTRVPFLGESEKETQKVIESVADSLQCSSGKDKDLETSLGVNDMELKNDLEQFAEAPQPADNDANAVEAEPSGNITPKGKTSNLKSSGKRLQTGEKIKGTLSQGMDKENATVLQGPNERVHLVSAVTDEKKTQASPGENVMETEKAIDGSGEAPVNVFSVQKKQPRKLKAKAKLRKNPAAPLMKTKVGKGTPRLEQNYQNNNNSLDVNKQHSSVDRLNSLEVNTSEGDEQKTIAEKDKQNQLTEEKTGLTENKRRRKKRQRQQVLDSNKKQKKEDVTAADVTNQKLGERKEQLVNTDKREKDGDGKVKIGGLIFMCNAKTRPDCFRFSVMGVQEKRKDYVMGIKPGLKLFLYDYDLKLLYGIFQASSVGGMKLERNAFGGSFPAQVRFKVFSDCIPLPESQFRKAIKENYNSKNKFKTELTTKQVFKLTKLFRPAPLPAQITHAQPIHVLRDADRKGSGKDRYAPGNSRTHSTHTRERRHNASPPPRREEQPSDVYLSEREYRAYGLRRESSQHYSILPPALSYHDVNRDRVPLDLYHPSVDHDRLLRNAEIERHDHSREVRLHRLPESDYHPYDHLSSRREILARHSPDPPASVVAMENYRRDPYHSYNLRAPENPPRTYLRASSVREDDDLYSRYVTADSLAEYYRSSSFRYPSMAESERPPSSITSRYAYSGYSPYSRR